MLNLQAEIGSAFVGISKEDVLDLSKLDSHEYRHIINIPQFVTEKFPRSFVTYSANDFLCPGQGEPFIELLRSKGVDVTPHCGDKKYDVHCYHLFWHSKNGRDCMKKTKEFLVNSATK
jgi:hypothetical protein